MSQYSKKHHQKVLKRKVIEKNIREIPLVVGAFGASKGCTGIVEKVDTPPEGGVFTKYIGCNYPWKGYPDIRIIEYIYPSKRILAGFLYASANKSIRFLFGITFLSFLMFPRKMKRHVIIGLLDYILQVSRWIEYKQPFPLPTEAYCPAVKETYRVTEVLLRKVKDLELLIRLKKLRDIPCMWIEMDTAYRLRYQDIIPEFNKDELRKNPIRETKRVLNIFIEREAVDGDNGLVAKWRGLERILMLGLRFKGIRNIFIEGLLELDFDKVKADEADWYFMLDRDDYQYGGVPYEERMKISAEMDKKAGNKRPEIVFKQKLQNG